ncbi:MAG TPA: hypothetical protein VFT91_09585, partial [Dehalococcoidia bacterium]|nr:hypothetical protein [Dehalococcoidia bacterium]
SGNSAFIARGGRIVVTVDHSKLLNGNMLWYPQRDFLVERVSLVVTETLVGTAPDLTLTTLLDSRGDDLIVAPISQGQVAAGTVITAAENPRTYARLTGGRAFRMKGTKPSEVSSLPIPALGDRLAVFTHGAWTQGAALLIIEGSYLAYA